MLTCVRLRPPSAPLFSQVCTTGHSHHKLPVLRANTTTSKKNDAQKKKMAKTNICIKMMKEPS